MLVVRGDGGCAARSRTLAVASPSARYRRVTGVIAGSIMAAIIKAQSTTKSTAEVGMPLVI